MGSVTRGLGDGTATRGWSRYNEDNSFLISSKVSHATILPRLCYPSTRYTVQEFHLWFIVKPIVTACMLLPSIWTMVPNSTPMDRDTQWGGLCSWTLIPNDFSFPGFGALKVVCVLYRDCEVLANWEIPACFYLKCGRSVYSPSVMAASRLSDSLYLTHTHRLMLGVPVIEIHT